MKNHYFNKGLTLVKICVSTPLLLWSCLAFSDPVIDGLTCTIPDGQTSILCINRTLYSKSSTDLYIAQPGEVYILDSKNGNSNTGGGLNKVLLQPDVTGTWNLACTNGTVTKTELGNSNKNQCSKQQAPPSPTIQNKSKYDSYHGWINNYTCTRQS